MVGRSGSGSREEPVKPLRVSVALAVLLTAALPGQDLPPWVLLLARVKQHGRASFEHLPDYACLETVSRFRKSRMVRSFTPIDTLQLEVALVGGKELFARKGATHFQGDDPAAFIVEGLIGSGDFAATPRNLFVHDAARITVSSQAGLSGGTALPFDFAVSAMTGAYFLKFGGLRTVVGAQGTFWVDSQSLDLLRIEQHDVDLPADADVSEIVTTTTFGRVRIGSSEPLLPLSSELIVADPFGGQRRNLIEFSGCREYRSDSVIHFEDDVPDPPPAGKKK